MRILGCVAVVSLALGLAACSDEVQPKPSPTLEDREKVDADRTPPDRPKPPDPPVDPQTAPVTPPVPAPAPAPAP